MDAASDQKKLWLVLPFILIGPFLSLFDQSVVNLSAAAINASLHLVGGVAGFAVTGAVTLTAVPNVAPNFTKGFLVQVGFACAAIICAWALALRVKAE